MNDRAFVEELTWRLSADEDGASIVGTGDIRRWPDNALEELLRLRVFGLHTPAQSIVCPGCDDGHLEDVERVTDTGGLTHLVIRCARHGRVEVQPETLLRWRLDRRAFAVALGRMLGASREPGRLDGGRGWVLRVSDPGGAEREICLDCSPQGNVTSAFGVFLVASSARLPAPGVLPLSAILAWDGAALSVDRGELDRCLARRAVVGREQSGYIFRRDGAVWELAFGGNPFRMNQAKGIGYIATLLGQPGAAIAASELEVPMMVSGTTGTDQSLSIASGKAQPVIDAKTLSALAAKLEEIDEQISAVHESGDIERLEALLDERAGYENYRRSSVGLAGRPRSFGTPDKQTASRVQRAIHRSIDAIRVHEPAMALHLSKSITTGYEVVYQPVAPIDWSL